MSHPSLTDREPVTPDKPFTAPIVDVSDAYSGFWLLAEDGSVYAYGRADHLGDGVGHPGVRFAAIAFANGGHDTGEGQDGYWLLTEDGQAFPFGDARPQLPSGLFSPGASGFVDISN